MRAILVQQRLVVDDLVLNRLEDDALDALSELERRDGFGDGNRGRVHRSDNGDSSVAREGGLEDLSELRVAVGDVRSVRKGKVSSVGKGEERKRRTSASPRSLVTR